jgi:signal transduction histidine kinase
MITPAHKRALNRALHELRRPLQALVLMEEYSTQPAASPPAASRRGLLEVAASALRDLDGAVNGDAPSRAPGRFSCREVVLAALERWRPIAARAGGIRVYWDAGPAPVEGDAVRMAQALDNLISNALEHGGPPLVVTGARVAGRIRVTIANGASSRSTKRDPDPRRGHGTDLVSQVASAHRGRFALCRTDSGCVAALELPLAEPGYALAA